MQANFNTIRRVTQSRSLMAVIVAATAISSAKAENLVVNGSFQSTGSFAGWSVHAAPIGSALTITASYAYSGARAAAFSATQGVPDQISQIVPTSAGRNYEVSFRYRNIQAGGGPQADAFVAAWENRVVFGGSPAPVPTDEWERITLTLAARTSGSELRFLGYDAGAVVVLDDVEVVQEPVIMANGGFEFGDFSGWTTQAAPSGSAFEVVTDPAGAHGGNCYAKFEGRFSADRIAQAFPTTPGHPYELSFWVKNAVAGGDHLRVEWDGIIVYDRTPLDVAGGAWTRVSIPVTAASATSTVRFSAYDQTSVICLDDVELAPLTPPLILNGSFELGTGPVGVLASGSTAMTAWTVSRGNIDWTPSTYWQAADGFHSVDLQGMAGVGGVQQSVVTEAGVRYRMTFSLAGNPDGGPSLKHMQVRAGDAASPIFEFDTTGRSRSNMGWQERVFMFDATGTTSAIELFSTDPSGSWGAVIDNVRLVAVPCPADINGSGMLTVQDIFDFLARYFASDAGADLNLSGEVSVQDIFDFMAAYFAGC